MANEGRKLISKLRKMAEALNDMAFETQGDAVLPADRLAFADAMQGVVSGGLTLAGKFGFSEVWEFGLYASAVRGEKLTAVEIIRQVLNASRDNQAFADALRELADEICKSPDAEDDEALR